MASMILGKGGTSNSGAAAPASANGVPYCIRSRLRVCAGCVGDFERHMFVLCVYGNLGYEVGRYERIAAKGWI